MYILTDIIHYNANDMAESYADEYKIIMPLNVLYIYCTCSCKTYHEADFCGI